MGKRINVYITCTIRQNIVCGSLAGSNQKKNIMVNRRKAAKDIWRKHNNCCQ